MSSTALASSPKVTAPVFSARRVSDRYDIGGPARFRAGRASGDGVFAEWHWVDGRLSIARDRYGVQPLFWSTTPTSVHISPSIGALLEAGVPAELDDAAMAVFLRVGFFVGDDTPFAAIRALPPASTITWTNGDVAIAGLWHYPPAAAIDRPTAVRHFGDAFTAAVERCARQASAPTAVLLSGGHDSRHILLAMREIGRLPDRSVTVLPYPPAGADEVAIARQVAAAAGVRHVLLPQRKRRIDAECEKNALTHYCADEHVQFLPLRDYFGRHRCEVFDGLAGDVLSQSQRLDPDLHADFVEGRFEDAADRILGSPVRHETALARLLTPAASARFTRELAVARVAAEAERHGGAPNPIAGFFFFSRMRREVALAPFALLDVCDVSTPFLDSGLADFLLSLPFALVADRTLHTETLHRRYPTLAHLPFDRKRPGRDDGWQVRRDAAALLAVALTTRSAIVDTRGVAARAARAMATGASRHLWFVPRIMHAVELERRYTEFTH
jgi:hypothetical protein